MEEKKYAVLIDGDNISSKYLDSILNEMTKYGIATYKRIYCDFTSQQSSKRRQTRMSGQKTRNYMRTRNMERRR